MRLRSVYLYGVATPLFKPPTEEGGASPTLPEAQGQAVGPLNSDPAIPYNRQDETQPRMAGETEQIMGAAMAIEKQPKRTKAVLEAELLKAVLALEEAEKELEILRSEIESDNQLLREAEAETEEARDSARAEMDAVRDAAALLVPQLRSFLGMVTIRAPEAIQELDRALGLLEGAL